MFKSSQPSLPKKPAASGMEMMFRSLGLGDAIESIKMMVESGALDKILAFADDAHELQRIIKMQSSLIALQAEQVAALLTLVHNRMPEDRSKQNEVPGNRAGIRVEPGDGSAIVRSIR